MDQLTTGELIALVICTIVGMVTLAGILLHASRPQAHQSEMEQEEWAAEQSGQFGDPVLRRMLRKRRELEQQINHRKLELDAQEAK